MSSRAKNSQYDRKEPEPPAHSDFVNHGLNHWNDVRQQWRNGVGIGTPTGPPPKRKTARAPVDADEIIERIFHPTGVNQPLKEPVSLGIMIQILNEVWEAEGLCD
jgi:hypothetical protein